MKIIRTGYNDGLFFGFPVKYEYLDLGLLAFIYDIKLEKVQELWDEATDYHDAGYNGKHDYLNFATDLEIISHKSFGIKLQWPDDASDDYCFIGKFTPYDRIEDIRKHVANKYDLDWTLLNKNFNRETKADWYAVVSNER